MQLCNLSIAVARHDDTLESMKRKVEVATAIGTIQSMATNFPGMRDDWRKNAIAERLLGVDITGQLDAPILQEEGVFEELRRHAVYTNKVMAKWLGINQAAAVTCVKPSGNSSVLLDCAAGLHARKYRHYIRRLRVGAHSPIFNVLRHCDVPMTPENGQEEDTATTWVVQFPVAAPEGAIVQKEQTALDQLAWWLRNKLEWTEHNPSATITYEDDELEAIKDWLFEHQEYVGGLSFLPKNKVQYEQMPYEEITEEEYHKMVEELPAIDFSLLPLYEAEDMTTVAHEVACVGGACEY